jgi:hypothetical protein
MNKKSKIYIFFLTLMIASFFIFTGGITDSTVSGVPTLSDFAMKTSSPAIYVKIPFSIHAVNTQKEENSSNCHKEYQTSRDLSGTLEIRQSGSNALISKSDFIFVSETGDKTNGFTALFVDTISVNYTGNYKAIARFGLGENLQDNEAAKDSINFIAGSGSAIPLTAGTYRLKTFTAQCASGGTYTYTNSAATNNLVINSDLISASLNITMLMGTSALSQYPCLQDSNYNYNASGNYSIGLENGSEYFKIEYENSAFVNFNFSYDGKNLTLNYSKNGSIYVMNFVKQ